MLENNFSMVISRSKWLLIYLTAIHGLMLVMITVLLPNIWLLVMAVIIVATSFVYYCQCYQWIKSDRAIIKVERDAKGRWMLFHSDKSSTEKLVLKHCVATSKLVILYFIGSSHWRDKSVVILEDAVDTELFRQLRVYCRDPKIFLQ